MKQLINPHSLKRSITEALELTHKCEASIARVRGFISSSPSGTVHISHYNNEIRFYYYPERYGEVYAKRTYLSKHSPLLYQLCRKKYLLLLLHLLELRNELCTSESISRRQVSTIHTEYDKVLGSLLNLIDSFAKGNLDIARIVLTGKQYKWYSGRFRQKKMNARRVFNTEGNIVVRSKSERDLGNSYEGYAIPYHYEELLVLNVTSIVSDIQNQLSERGLLSGSLCYEKGNSCYWNVPEILQWMNAPGSVWRSYNPVTGKIYVYNDFHTLLADGELFIHEHEGLLDDIVYRCNSNERISLMKLSGSVKPENIMTTSEKDVTSKASIDKILKENLLPKIWF